MVKIPGFTPISRLIFVAALLALCVFSLQAQEKKNKMTKKDLPPAVLAAFEKEYPHAEIKGVGKEKEKGAMYYEIESMDGKIKRDLLYTPEGKKAEAEEVVTMAAVPANVKETLAREYPKGKVEKSEKVMRDTLTVYEFHVKVESKTHEVTIDATGKLLGGGKDSQDKDDDDDDDDEVN